MRNLWRLAWAAAAAAVAAATAAPASAQNQGGPTVPGGNLPTTFQTAPATTTQTQTPAQTTTDSGTNSGSAGTTIELSPVEQAPRISAPSSYAKAGGAVQSSNFLGPTFANPYYSGLLANTRSGTFTPGGFGTPTFGAATGARAGVTAGTTGRAGGTGGGTFSTDPGGQIVQLPRQIAYTAQLKFVAPTVPAPRLQADLRGMIDRAGLTVPAGSVQVQVDGNAVVLRGAVRDGDEARLVEGLVRLTPGVSRVSNELSYPR